MSSFDIKETADANMTARSFEIRVLQLVREAQRVNLASQPKRPANRTLTGWHEAAARRWWGRRPKEALT